MYDPTESPWFGGSNFIPDVDNSRAYRETTLYALGDTASKPRTRGFGLELSRAPHEVPGIIERPRHLITVGFCARLGLILGHG
jgi:hypothetical protein